MRAEGNTHLYQFNSEGLQAISKDLFSREQIAALVDDVAYDAWEQKVLNSFSTDDGRLTRLPASRKKRLVVLRWLVEQFEMGVNYPEQAVNTIIQRYHPDTATIRREFIGHKLMARAGGEDRVMNDE